MVINVDIIEDLPAYFLENRKESFEMFFDAIKKGFESKKKVAFICYIYIRSTEESFEITLRNTEWTNSLEKMQEFFREVDEPDKAIAAYILKKKVIKWLAEVES